jgi:hypothetical protein
VKAIRVHSFGGPEVLQLETVDDPVPGPGEVAVELRAAGVNPADTYMRSGTYAILPKLPYIPGGDGGGVISAIGAAVTEHKIGDRVFVGTALSFDLTGCYAEKVKRKRPRCCRLLRMLLLLRRRPSACGASREHGEPEPLYLPTEPCATSASPVATPASKRPSRFGYLDPSRMSVHSRLRQLKLSRYGARTR